MQLEVKGLNKKFRGNVALEDVSFSVEAGEVFGLLGPNGAGKTTMIRIILDILRQDSGTVSVMGRKLSEEVKDSIGYLPEEGSLYRDSTVMESLVYFSSLKGTEIERERVNGFLSRFGLLEHKDKKISELSKGMQRKLLFIISVIHEPDVLILDEPFSGLDPINRRLMKDVIMELNEKGMTIIMSTHQMGEVERMCDRILMINRGRNVLYGDLDNIKKKYGYSVFVDYIGRFPRKIPGIMKIDDYGSHAEIVMKKGSSTQSLLRRLVGKVEIRKFEVRTRSLDDIFIEVAENG